MSKDKDDISLISRLLMAIPFIAIGRLRIQFEIWKKSESCLIQSIGLIAT